MDFESGILLENWFTERGGGIGVTVEVTDHIFSRKSPFQQIDIYQTSHLGKMLVLDGHIQFTEFDEFAYQEMMTHVPMFAHPDPRNVLVIGGGDGGVLREIAKHDCVEHIDICEIDGEVIDAARKYVPSLAIGYEDPRVSIHVADGSEFVKGHQGFYDVIIVDSTDPVGPGESLFNEQFYRGMRSALRENGIIASQSESLFLHPAIISRLTNITKKLFDKCGYATIMVPTYPAGQIGVCVGSLGPDIKKPIRQPDAAMQAKLKYYTVEHHQGAFMLPYFGELLLANIN
jgi:spermidine synthase